MCGERCELLAKLELAACSLRVAEAWKRKRESECASRLGITSSADGYSERECSIKTNRMRTSGSSTALAWAAYPKPLWRPISHI
jgi:hypothetical protein